ncbi:GNAT family N-acetyltransferase [Natrinema sp. 1APR25-10V2]|uniref:GNAT family N-acetyltransferase n=1 Tax=Natrinema sp. 1APR25-10V2 TaxID=2951081 RepID=UPI0028758495|nr:GNAT family N-acetyltransferase [Natrinema sp. 1APR25-10V2]MDS0475685.1 GNAT family N-acetyltransferase [Natrinema sp. 1APR25-10V2]
MIFIDCYIITPDRSPAGLSRGGGLALGNPPLDQQGVRAELDGLTAPSEASRGSRGPHDATASATPAALAASEVGYRGYAAAGETGASVTQPADACDVRILETLDAVAQDRWNGVVAHAPQGSVFHRYEWLHAIETGLGATPRHLLVTKDGNPIGLLPHFVRALPVVPFRRLQSLYPGFGGPAITTDAAAVLSRMTATVPACCSGRTIVHEIRACNTDYLRYSTLLRAQGYRLARLTGRFQLRLEQGYARIWDGMSTTRRKEIRRGRERDADIVEEPITRATLRRFYQAYTRHMAQVGGDPYPFAFFAALQAMADRLLVLTLRIDGDYAGGFLELLDDDQDTVHGLFAAVPEDDRDAHASALLYDHVTCWAIDHGYATYDFGGRRTTSGGGRSALRRVSGASSSRTATGNAA